MSAKKTVCILVPSNFLKTQLFLTLNSGCSRQWRCHEQEDIPETRLPCGEKWGWHSYSSYHHIFVFWFVSVFVFVFETSLASVDGPCSLSSSVYIDALIHLPGYLGGDVSFTHTASCARLDKIWSGDGADIDLFPPCWHIQTLAKMFLLHWASFSRPDNIMSERTSWSWGLNNLL